METEIMLSNTTDAEQTNRDVVPDPARSIVNDDYLSQLFGADWRSSIPSASTLMAENTTEQLRRELRRTCPRAKTTGTKHELAKKLNYALLGRLRSPVFARECLTSNSKPGKPETTRFHGDTFNGVDVFDLLMSFLKPDDRVNSQEMLLVGWLARLSVVHGHSLHSTLRWAHIGDTWHPQDKAEYDRQMGDMRAAHESYILARREVARGLRPHPRP